jgi:hypothetical protein
VPGFRPTRVNPQSEIANPSHLEFRQTSHACWGRQSQAHHAEGVEPVQLAALSAAAVEVRVKSSRFGALQGASVPSKPPFSSASQINRNTPNPHADHALCDSDLQACRVNIPAAMLEFTPPIPTSPTPRPPLTPTTATRRLFVSSTLLPQASAQAVPPPQRASQSMNRLRTIDCEMVKCMIRTRVVPCAWPISWKVLFWRSA